MKRLNKILAGLTFGAIYVSGIVVSNYFVGAGGMAIFAVGAFIGALITLCFYR